MGAAAAEASGRLGCDGLAGTAVGVVARAVSVGLARSIGCLALAGWERSWVEEPLARGAPIGVGGFPWAAAASRSSSSPASSAMRGASARQARTSASLEPRAEYAGGSFGPPLRTRRRGPYEPAARRGSPWASDRKPARWPKGFLAGGNRLV